jgi:hypothetical protein
MSLIYAVFLVGRRTGTGPLGRLAGRLAARTTPAYTL